MHSRTSIVAVFLLVRWTKHKIVCCVMNNRFFLNVQYKVGFPVCSNMLSKRVLLAFCMWLHKFLPPPCCCLQGLGFGAWFLVVGSINRCYRVTVKHLPVDLAKSLLMLHSCLVRTSQLVGGHEKSSGCVKPIPVLCLPPKTHPA